MILPCVESRSRFIVFSRSRRMPTVTAHARKVTHTDSPNSNTLAWGPSRLVTSDTSGRNTMTIPLHDHTPRAAPAVLSTSFEYRQRVDIPSAYTHRAVAQCPSTTSSPEVRSTRGHQDLPSLRLHIGASSSRRARRVGCSSPPPTFVVLLLLLLLTPSS